MTPHPHVRSLPPGPGTGHFAAPGGLASVEAECRGSKSACADLDGTKAGHISCLAARREAA
jgi:hypothetical protein